MPDADAAAAAAADLLATDPTIAAQTEPDVAEETPSGPEATAAEETQPEAEATDEDILSLIENYKGEEGEDEEPDFEAEAEEEIVARAPQEEEYVDDPELMEERKLRLAAEKKLAWMEGQKVKGESVKWREEAGRRWPLSKPFLDDIDAKSHRAFNREAQKIQSRLEPWFEQNYAGPLKDYLEKQREQIASEEREKAAQAWGKHSVGPGTVPVDSSARQERFESAQRKGDLVAMVKERAFGGGDA